MPPHPLPSPGPLPPPEAARPRAGAPARVGSGVPAVVLDTNAVLDWLVFRDPRCSGWHERFADGRVCWLASEAMRHELATVLARPALAAWRPSPDAVWAAWARWAQMRDAPTPAGPAGRVRCTDPDDQKFVDLALAAGARWLVSRDRAVLKLGRRTRALGLDVVTPDAWAGAFPAA